MVINVGSGIEILMQPKYNNENTRLRRTLVDIKVHKTCVLYLYFITL